MEAAFIDIGKGRNAVLYAGEVNWDLIGDRNQPRRIENALKSAWTPDGVMICFGSTEEAIRAAQSVLLDLARFNAEVKAVKTQFRVRCGINSGPVHYDKTQRMEEMSDRVIDVAGHMQKYAAADTIFISGEALNKGSENEGFRATGTKVDGYDVFHWKAPSADPTLTGYVAPSTVEAAAAASANATQMTSLTSLSELSNPRGGTYTPTPTSSIADRTQRAPGHGPGGISHPGSSRFSISARVRFPFPTSSSTPTMLRTICFRNPLPRTL